MTGSCAQSSHFQPPGNSLVGEAGVVVESNNETPKLFGSVYSPLAPSWGRFERT